MSQKTQICKHCFKEIKDTTLHNLFHKNVALCHKCFVELSPVLNEFEIEGIKCTNIYWYSEEIQGLLYQFKGCSDIELKNVFFDYYKDYFSFKYKNYVVIPAPSSEEANAKRGFNQVIEMFSSLKFNILQCIHKTKDFKQHELTSEERKKVVNLLKIDDVNLTKKKVLLVDDVYTTGSTIKAMVELVKQKNPKKIEVLVMAKTKDLDQRQI